MSDSFKTPILLIVFNRPNFTAQLFERIRKLRPSQLYIAADGPRLNVANEKANCDKTKLLFETIDWPCEIKTLYHIQNLGCKRAVGSAIQWFFDHVEAGIILEDDCLPSKTFFSFCEELLIKYQHNPDIHVIGGNCFQLTFPYKDSYYFSHYPHIWGWASWRRVWVNYELNMQSYHSNALDNYPIKKVFNSVREKRYWKNIFSRCRSNRINTWDYQLTYAVWKNGGICITPSVNLVMNIGLKGESTHYFLNDSHKDLIAGEINFPLIHPANLNVNRKADIYTFENIFSHSISRGIRLIRENSIKNIFQYLIYKIIP